MSKTHGDIVNTNFGPRASAYGASAVHAGGLTLRGLLRFLRVTGAGRFLILGAVRDMFHLRFLRLRNL